MADGIVCLYCGRYETDHELGLHELGLEEANELVHGYQVPLSKCPGYQPEDKGLAERLENQAAEEKIARQARTFAPYG